MCLCDHFKSGAQPRRQRLYAACEPSLERMELRSSATWPDPESGSYFHARFVLADLHIEQAAQVLVGVSDKKDQYPLDCWAVTQTALVCVKEINTRMCRARTVTTSMGQRSYS